MTGSRIIYIVSIVVAGILACAFEFGLLPEGVLQVGSAAEYWAQIVCVALTLASLPLALKWRKIAVVDKFFTACENGRGGIESDSEGIEVLGEGIEVLGEGAESRGDGEAVNGVGESRMSAICRIAVLFVPLCLNVVCYYLFGTEPTFAYMALMVLVGYAFIWPQGSR